MAQVKIYGEHSHLRRMRDRLSKAIHATAMDVLGLPANKRFHRFIGIDREDFIYPSDRSGAYTIVEISLFEGRSDETKRAFLQSLMHRVCDETGLVPADLEITLFETPKHHWGIRGAIADELVLPYAVER